MTLNEEFDGTIFEEALYSDTLINLEQTVEDLHLGDSDGIRDVMAIIERVITPLAEKIESLEREVEELRGTRPHYDGGSGIAGCEARLDRLESAVGCRDEYY
jgi:hypothetical protein